MKALQTGIFLAVTFAFVHFEVVTPGLSGVAVAAFASYALTIWPIKFYYWLRYGHIKRARRRAEYAAKKAAGHPYGWRRHLPWNARVKPWPNSMESGRTADNLQAWDSRE